MPSPAAHPAWPALTFEELTWTPTVPPELVSRSMRERAGRPYRAAIIPPMVDRSPRLPSSLEALVSDATAAIARFDSEVGGELAPFSSMLLRAESTSSSRIEDLTSGAKAILLAEMGSRDKRNASEIVGNVAAMQAALRLADQPTPARSWRCIPRCPRRPERRRQMAH